LDGQGLDDFEPTLTPEIRSRRQLNASIPFRTFPVEIIQTIFLDASFAFDKAYRAIPATFASVQLSHVSTLWRAIALAIPGMWSHLDASFPDTAIAELLMRSKGIPLFLCSNCSVVSASKSRRFFESISKVLTQWQEVAVGFGSKGEDFLDRLPTLRSVTMLDSLEVNYGPQRRPLNLGPLPDTKFEGAPFRIRSLILAGNAFPWNSSVYTSASELVMLYVSCFANEPIPSLLRSWATFKNLRVLDLNHCQSYCINEENPFEGQVFSFACLEQLLLGGETVFCVHQLLALIQAPNCTLVFVSILGGAYAASLDSKYPTGNILPTSQKDGSQTLRNMHCQAINSAILSGVFRQDEYTFIGKSASEGTTFRFSIENATDTTLHTLYRQPSFEDFPNLTSLTFHGISAIDVSACCAVLLAIPAILELYLKEMRETRAIVDLLGGLREPARVPKLRVLEFHQSKLDASSLAQCLRNRHAKGCAGLRMLALVHISRWLVPRQKVQVLEELMKEAEGKFILRLPRDRL